ncbi:MAG: BatD family protein [Pseudomonadota bacterium]
MIRPWRTLVAILAFSLLPVLAQATVQATLDRSTAHLGETVTLNLHSDTAPITAPDLSALGRDFQVLGQSSGTTSSFVNGQRTVDYSYGVALRPLHEGTLQIPSLAVGNEQTQPLTLEVTAPNPADADVHGPVFVEARFDPQLPYVGQQVALSVKLYYTTNLANASLSDPAIDGADVNRLGNDIDYQAQRNGRTYNVIERRYAVVPQKAGELTMAPIMFQGDLLDPNDPNSFLGMGSPVQAQSNALTLQVQPPPAGWGQSAWLPARQLTLGIDGLPDAGTPVRVGQPFNLTLHIDATGLSFEALPALTLPTLDGATAYPDKPVTGNRVDGGWIVGHREHRFAIVPGRAGTLTIPAITVKWWNVVTRQAETATIPAHSINVLPAIGAAAPTGRPAPAASAPAAPAMDGRPATVPAPESTTAAGTSSPWKWVALAIGALWMLTLAALLLRRRRIRRPAVPAGATPRVPPPTKERREYFLRAVRTGDVAVQARTLLAWAQAERPGLRHLEAVAVALDSDEQRAAIASLERARYAGTATGPSAAALEAAFARGFVWRDEREAGSAAEPLPPLYPFKLR